METNLIVIDPKKYGLETTKADEIAEAFREPLAELAELETEYKEFENLTGEPPESTCNAARALKQKYVKNRKEREAIHKTEKAYFLNAGRYVDAWKNKALEVSEEREKKLSEIADYYENLKKEKIKELAAEREEQLLACQIGDDMYIPPNLGEMEEEIWNNYYSGVKNNYDRQKEEERKAEEKRIEDQRRHSAVVALGYGTDHKSYYYGDIKIDYENLMNCTPEEFENLYSDIEDLIIAEKERFSIAEKEAAAAKAEAEKNERALQRERAKRKAEEETRRKEQEEKERIEREAKEKAEAEKKAKEAAPDKEKLIELAKTLEAGTYFPLLETDQGNKALHEIKQSFNQFIEIIYQWADKL